MNTYIDTGINYCGFASLKILRNGKEIQQRMYHNSGTDALFTALAASLCGQQLQVNMPQYFDLGFTDSNYEYTSAINMRVPLSSKLVKNYSTRVDNKLVSAKVAAVFTAYIPSRLISSELRINRLSMYSLYTDNDRESLLAEITIDDSKATTLTASDVYSYMVEWVMTFLNVVTVKATKGDN